METFGSEDKYSIELTQNQLKFLQHKMPDVLETLICELQADFSNNSVCVRLEGVQVDGMNGREYLDYVADKVKGIIGS